MINKVGFARDMINLSSKKGERDGILWGVCGDFTVGMTWGGTKNALVSNDCGQWGYDWDITNGYRYLGYVETNTI